MKWLQLSEKNGAEGLLKMFFLIEADASAG